ncbi:ABC transporter permease [Paenibacillus sp. FSL K6-1096]|uniref:ABC transporter permease n=1 Tax=Paenibacillus sp. FSL K6-1096 TaxID=2921460 RepID=UPI0030ED5A77
MIHLMKLELKKIKLGPYIIGFCLLNAAIVGIIYSLLSVLDPLDVQMMYPSYPNYEFVYKAALTMVKISATLLMAILLAQLVVGEYKTGTISTLFLYPISRRNLLLAKLLLVMLLGFVFMLVSMSVSVAFFYVVSPFKHFIPEPISVFADRRLIGETGFQSLLTVAASFIPLSIGMSKRSATALLIASFVLAIILYLPINAPNNDIIFGSNPWISLIFAAAGVAAAFETLYKVERKDVLLDVLPY